MDTTHARIQVALKHIDRSSSSTRLNQLATELQRRQLEEFRISAEGRSVSDYMKPASIERQIKLMGDLELVRIESDGSVSLTSKGRRSLDSEEAYDRQICSSVKSFLQNNGLPLNKIVGKIEEIELPDVPDADTIYDTLEDVDHSLDRDTLRTLLFLYACADGIDRVMRVHYRPRQ